MLRVSLLYDYAHSFFNMNNGYDSFRGIPSPGLFPLYGEGTEPLSFIDQLALSLQWWSAEEIWELLRSLPQETLVSLHYLLDAAVDVHKNEFSPNDHFSPASNSTGEMINSGDQTGPVAVGEEANNVDHNLAAKALAHDGFVGNADSSSYPDSDQDETQGLDFTIESEESAADNGEQEKRSKYFFVKDEKKVILHRYIKKRDELRRQGMRGTVKEVAPLIIGDIYGKGYLRDDRRVKVVRRRLKHAIKRNPMRKRPSVEVITNVIYNRTHNKNGSL